MKNAHYVLINLVYILLFSFTQAAVDIKINGLQVTIKNDLVELNFKDNARISNVYVNGRDIAAHGTNTFYLDWSVGHQVYFAPDSVHIVEQSSSRVHFYWLEANPAEGLASELHYIMEDGLPGAYSYVKSTNNKNDYVSLGLYRIVYRFEPTILSQGYNPERRGYIPTGADLADATEVQDNTYEYPNGTYYTKYDWSSYMRETEYQGLYGNGFGAFVISPSREFYDGGSMKQTLPVQQVSLMMTCFTSNHFAISPALNAPPGWTHFYGPWLLYFPTGNDNEVLAAAQRQTDIEKGKWPYTFINDDQYPLQRGSISGQVTGQTNAQVVVYDSLGENHELQKLGYVFTTRTDSNGNYFIDKIRPGSYRVVAYPLAGQGCENEAEALVDIYAGNQAQVNLYLPEPQNIMWSIGEVNRRASEFKYADQPRNYAWNLAPPQDLTFTIGVSDPKNDWYYAQVQGESHWYIKYNDNHDGKTRTLRVALAATSRNPHLYAKVNGHQVGSWSHGNDRAIYRSSMQSGQYTYHIASVKAAAIIDGENTIELLMAKGELMYDAISLQRDD